MVIITIRAYDKDGYHKDIAIMSERQTYLTCTGVEGPRILDLPPGEFVTGAGIDPSAFPEMVRFDVLVTIRK